MNARSSPARPDTRYRDRHVAVGTRHRKQDQFIPAFAAILGAHLVTPDDLDTDQFGTFSGEVGRRGTAADAARAKARLAMEVSGLPFGLATEASYGPLRDADLPGHEEIALFIDTELGIEVLEGYRTTVVPGSRHAVSRHTEVPDYLLAGLPDQALIVWARGADTVKGITDAAGVAAAVAAVAPRSPDGLAIVEPDLRAHHNPGRRRVLTTLAERPARSLATACPSCGSPGFGRVDVRCGLPCRLCETPTTATWQEVRGCPRCAHTATIPVAERADPAICPVCNP